MFAEMQYECRSGQPEDAKSVGVPRARRRRITAGGVPRYDLDFGGTLSRDAEVSIETGLHQAQW